MFNASRVQRVFFFNMAVLSLIGLWLTGFDKVHWFAYIIPGGLLFAAATGFCLGMLTSRLLLNVLGIEDKPARGSSVSS
mgnify:CR=1 FL=1|jgi:hypothetical protein